MWYAYAVFLVALLREFGWSRTVLAGAFSLFAFVHGVAGAPIGWLCDRVGPRRLVLAGGAILAVGLVLDGAVTRPWHLYVTFGIVTSLGVSAAGWTPAVVLVQRGFPRRVGTVLGFTSAGIGVGILVVVPLCQHLVDIVGWRWAFRFLGVLVALWVIPSTLWLVEDPIIVKDPIIGQGMGTRAGATPMPRRNHAERSLDSPIRVATSVRDITTSVRDITLGEAAASARFWLLGLTTLFGAFVNQMLLVHQVAYLVDHGIAALTAASVVGLVGLASIVGKAGGGWASDVFGREVTFTFGMTCVVASVGTLGLLALTGEPAWAWIYGALVGVGYAVTAPLMPAVISDLYRGRHFGTIFGVLHIANAVGGSTGPWVGGRVFDLTGSYAGAFGAAVVAAALSALALWLAAPRRQQRPIGRGAS